MHPNIGAPKYIKQIWTDMKGKINSYTRIEMYSGLYLQYWIHVEYQQENIDLKRHGSFKNQTHTDQICGYQSGGGGQGELNEGSHKLPIIR